MVKTAAEKTAVVDFQGRDPGERFAFYFRQHWVRLMGPMLQVLVAHAAVIGTGIFIFSIATPVESVARRTMLLFFIALILIVQWAFLVRLLRYFLYVIIITDRRIHRIKKTLLTIDDHQSMDLSAIQDIQKSQHGIPQNLLGFGSLTLEAQETVLRIHFVPRISKTTRRIAEIRENLRKR